jgi:hypothetical protein
MKFQIHIMASYMLNLDCNRIFKEIALEWRGGDKSNFVMGVIRRENSPALLSGSSQPSNIGD